eukprot:3400596-Prorocentrum_lima.AAC.1
MSHPTQTLARQAPDEHKIPCFALKTGLEVQKHEHVQGFWPGVILNKCACKRFPCSVVCVRGLHPCPCLDCASIHAQDACWHRPGMDTGAVQECSC